MNPNVHTDANSLRSALYGSLSRPLVAFVPTMGYLHEGHAALIRRAAELAPCVVVSIFVNPLQFGPAEDFDRYPRDFERDREIAARAGATDIYFPAASDLTPGGLAVTVDPGPMARVLCGRSRPGHFRGVTTIVAKLFHIVQPDIAVFGWKDAQQFVILRRMVEDLNFPVRMEAVETLREPDGLAMSSRNTYLTADQRREAPVVRRALEEAKRLYQMEGEKRPQRLVDVVRRTVETGSSGTVDYISCVGLSDLKPLRQIRPGDTLLAAAVRFGQTRLIDNVRF